MRSGARTRPLSQCPLVQDPCLTLRALLYLSCMGSHQRTSWRRVPMCSNRAQPLPPPHYVHCWLSFAHPTGMTQFTEFPVYGSQDGVLERVATHLADTDVVSVSYTVGANADTPVKGASSTHKVRAACVW